MRKLGFLIMLCVLCQLVLAVPVYVDVTAQPIQAMGVKHHYDFPPVDATSDSTTYDKCYVRGKTTDTYDDWGKIWLQFDLSDIFATYGKDKLASAKIKIWAENGTGRRFSLAGLDDGYNESWEMNTLTWTSAPGNDVASGTSLDTSKIYGGAPLWTVHNQTADSIPVDLGASQQDGTLGSNFDQCASYESIDSTDLINDPGRSPAPTAANANLKAFLLTDTDGLVTLIGYDHTNSSNQNWWGGIAGLYANDVADGYVTTDGRRVRDSVTLTLTFPPLGADNPSPYPDDVVYTTQAQLSWTNPDPNHAGDSITPTVYFGTEPNRIGNMQSITLAPDAISVPISSFTSYAPLQDKKMYYWAVDCYDPSKGVVTGLMWNFYVNDNDPPVVNAGTSQGVWDPNENNGAATLDATATDDGKPNPPGAMTYSWTQVDGPGTAVINSPSTEDTTVAMDAYGLYHFQLAVNDGGTYPDQTATFTVAFGSDACDASHILNGDNYYSGDFNTDCIVNVEDLAIMMSQWLDCTDTLDNCGV